MDVFWGRAFVASAVLCTGCFAPLKNLENASALEQQMTSAAISRSVAALEVDAIDPRSFYVLKIAAPTGVDTALFRARLQERLAEAQVRLHPETSKPEKAPRGPTLLAVVPFAAVDSEATLVGFPFIVPGMPVAQGDISLYKSSTLTGRARGALRLEPRSRARGDRSSDRGIALFPQHHVPDLGPFRFTNLDEKPLPGDEP